MEQNIDRLVGVAIVMSLGFLVYKSTNIFMPEMLNLMQTKVRDLFSTVLPR